MLAWMIAAVAVGLSLPAVAHAPLDAAATLAQFGRLSARAALVIDRETGEALFDKQSHKVLPIASITKLMAALVVLDSGVDLSEPVELTQADDKPSTGRRKSRLRAKVTLTRDELLRLTLMSSENKAAYALARSHPEGYEEFIRLMNLRAQHLGMDDTRFTEPTGLSDKNVSTARDLVKLAIEAERYPLIQQYSTQTQHQVAAGRRALRYVNSNRLVHQGSWDISLQKTGTTSKAGKCVVMQASMAGRQVVVVLLNARGRFARMHDARLLRKWLESEAIMSASSAGADQPR